MTKEGTSPETIPGHGNEVGSVITITSEGAVILRGREVPEGTLVQSSNGKFIGRVVKVFGPVEQPYLSVRSRRTLAAGDLLALVGKKMVVRKR